MVIYLKKLFIISLIGIFIDRITKILVSNIDSIVVIKNFFNITNTHNYGAAWSILEGYRILLIIVSIFVLVLIYMIFIKGKKLNNYEIFSYGILISGIIGNLIDRIIYGYVIDFLDFNILGYNYPVFNIADSFIVISIILLIIKEFRSDLNGCR